VAAVRNYRAICVRSFKDFRCLIDFMATIGEEMWINFEFSREFLCKLNSRSFDNGRKWKLESCRTLRESHGDFARRFSKNIGKLVGKS
jgi:hypothetical protein